MKSIAEEMKELTKEAEELLREGERRTKITDKNLEKMHSSLEAFYFLVYGTLLGLAINLFASVIHDSFSHLKYYILFVGTFLFVSAWLLVDFVTKKWKKILKEDELIRMMSKNTEPEYLQRMRDILERSKVLEEAAKKPNK